MNPANVDPATDLNARWLPSGNQIAAGVAALSTVDLARRGEFLAVVALAQPGKTFGLWETGQQVIAVPGIWLGHNTTGETAYPLREATSAAEAVAQHWLDAHHLSGTVAYAYVYPDGNAAVFESLLSLGQTFTPATSIGG